MKTLFTRIFFPSIKTRSLQMVVAELDKLIQ